MGEVRSLRAAEEAPLAKARRLRDEARDTALEVAEMLSGEAALLADRCAEASRLDTMPAGLADAYRKLAMEIESRTQSIAQIMAAGGR